ncbi:prolyl oligopeptidase family serine peptidase [Candidatus Shapirobacteria bacterium]|nr:prolyl oligopeptidase family serine peptidase [Candidatus Shapirobacteria bacterium]
MKKAIIVIFCIISIILGYYFWPRETINPKGSAREIIELSLEKYDFDSLRKRIPIASEIEILGPIKEVEDRRKIQNSKVKSQNEFETREVRFKSDGKWISGMMSYMPERSSLSPVIIMVRGYAEKIGYYPGSGSWKMADELAKQGYVTISLDFLGYANSDVESTDMLEARFHKVVEVLDLLESVKRIPWVDKSRIGFWAHSNGGQIVMSVLEVTGGQYPTVMWAPMTQPFPESVLSTIDEGSPVKDVIDEFQRHYDARRYAFDNYYQWINSPIMIQQGTQDEWVKVEWQNTVVTNLKGIGKNIELVIYKGADHNLKGPVGSGWEEAVVKAVSWYDSEW